MPALDMGSTSFEYSTALIVGSRCPRVGYPKTLGYPKTRRASQQRRPCVPCTRGAAAVGRQRGCATPDW